MQNDKVKVLYIASSGRSGSTILGNMLGELEGFFFVGEILNIWRHYLVENRLCGCGLPASDCEVWVTVIKEAFGSSEEINVQEMDYLRKHSIRNRYILEMLSPFGKSRLQSRLSSYLHNLEQLYQAIQQRTNSQVIVDGSKRATYSYLLELVPNIDLYVLHLVRDSRAVAYSWQRKKIQQQVGNDRVYMQQYGSLTSAIRWNVSNVTAEMFWRHSPDRYFQINYERFAANPRETIEYILNFIQEKRLELPFKTTNSITLSTNHAIWGNPNRFQRGVIKVQVDREWESNMKRFDRNLVTAFTWPLLIRYRYR